MENPEPRLLMPTFCTLSHFVLWNESRNTVTRSILPAGTSLDCG